MSKNDYSDFYDEHHLRYCDESYLDKRIIPFETALNMRDIGGYTNENNEPLKWKKIYRGEELNHLSPEDFQKFNKLGIKYVFDFRDDWAPQLRPDHLPDGAFYRNLPVLKDLDFPRIDADRDELSKETIGEFFKGLYLAEAKERVNEFAEVLKVLRDDPDAIVYIHCTNGKDRTGFMIALIMLLAGINEEKVISEYSLTNHTFNKAYETLSKGLGTITEEVDAEKEFYGVDPDWLQVQLDYINDNYPDIDSYLIENSDLTKEDLEIIRNNILER